MAEKSEKATPKKLRDARKKGQVAKSQDFPSAFTFMTSVAMILGLSSFLFQHLASFLILCFSLLKEDFSFNNSVHTLLSEAAKTILISSLPILCMVAMVGVLVNFLIIGPVFSVEVFKPNLKKLNPITNLKNMFKLKILFEIGKSLFKIIGAVFLVYTVVKNSLPDLATAAGLPIIESVYLFSTLLKQVMFRVGIFFVFIAVCDLMFQKANFAKEMKMEKHEVKQEYKETEGDPHIKGRRRQIAREIAYQEGPRAAKRAKMIVSNPTHIAVALEYDAETIPVPTIATMGSDRIAEEIIQIGLEYQIPIMRNIELAQTLFKQGTIGEAIPEGTYQIVADLLKWAARLEKGDVDYNKELFE